MGSREQAASAMAVVGYWVLHWYECISAESESREVVSVVAST